MNTASTLSELAMLYPVKPARAEATATGKELRTQVVCIVDDDPSVLKSVSRLLESEGFAVKAFSQPEACLDFISSHKVPVAILDIWMEPMTGMELLVHLAARSPQTHVIFITGRDDPGAKETVMQGGAFAFFIKPFDDSTFLAAVHRALGASPSG